MNFAHGVQNYLEAASIQGLAAEEICKIAAPFFAENLQVLDLGSGTGFVAREILKQVQDDENIRSRHPELVSGSPSIFELDLALEMLQQSPSPNSQKIQADFENLPFKNNSFDILISSFALQWLTDFDKSFSQFFSLLKPEGVFIFCLPCDGSLAELSAANIFNFNQLPKVEDLKNSLKKSGFSEISVETKTTKQTFESGVAALKSLKKIGANYSQKNSKVITKTNLAQFNNFCLKNFGTDTRKIEVSWVISYFIFSK
ncbi:MAG: methyltransferase domain-containing protein [Rickettsiales bacterium]|nr:methyltransferase domain-containing protein [Rickettsiales bacterium]